MKNESKIVIWENCDPLTSEAIKQFEKRWQPYSASSRRYPIIRLIEEVIDPAVTAYKDTLPAHYSNYVAGAGTGTAFSEVIRLVGLDAMVRLQREMLRRFIQALEEQTSRDQRFIATIESLTGLVWDCASKRPQKSTSIKGVNLNEQRKHGFFDLCGELTEFTSFLTTASENHLNDIEFTDPKKLELSHQYCSTHRPRLINGEWNPTYRRAKRSLAQFNLELKRLNHQCANRGTPRAASGDPLVDSFFYYYMLGQTVQPADKSELRSQARLMTDSKLTDRKKQILALQHFGFNQSEIARKLGIGRQAVSKALASIHEAFHLKQ
ncbi:helix-turn-helix domain-containing protein [Pectobacterium cacticida]|uniref:helix-turn-helix domain-containing protein n=1 Tax=Pectobacterium cacticida TaxID=69221 RepID=UPI002FF345EC